MLVVFCPFAAGYYLSYFYRYVNAVIAKDLVQDFGLAPGDLGLLTSAYFLAFAAFQLPLGVLLDRFGPRRCTAALMCVAAAGALTFGLAQDLAMLSAGRALIAATPVAGYVGCCHAISKLSTTARLKDIKGPVLAITGEQDAAAPGTRYIGEHVPGAKLVVIPQAAHIANIEQPEAFNRALREFLSSPASARA